MATVSLSRASHDTMLALSKRIEKETLGVSALHLSQKNLKEHFMVPTELQKQPDDVVVDGQLEAADECQKLCKQGTDPAEIQDCIGYCERLLFNTIEL